MGSVRIKASGEGRGRGGGEKRSLAVVVMRRIYSRQAKAIKSGKDEAGKVTGNG